MHNKAEETGTSRRGNRCSCQTRCTQTQNVRTPLSSVKDYTLPLTPLTFQLTPLTPLTLQLTSLTFQMTPLTLQLTLLTLQLTALTLQLTPLTPLTPLTQILHLRLKPRRTDAHQSRRVRSCAGPFCIPRLCGAVLFPVTQCGPALFHLLNCYTSCILAVRLTSTSSRADISLTDTH